MKQLGKFHHHWFGDVYVSEHLLITMRQMGKFHHHWFGDVDVSQRLHGVPSWNRFAQKFGLCGFTRRKFDDQHHHLWKL